MMPSLMIDHLSINLRSGTDNLVSEISFAIKEGESLILLGQSGSGKTMTCSAVLNLLDPKKFKVSGSIFFGETDLLNSSEKQRRGIYGNQIVYIRELGYLSEVNHVGARILIAPVNGVPHDSVAVHIHHGNADTVHTRIPVVGGCTAAHAAATAVEVSVTGGISRDCHTQYEHKGKQKCEKSLHGYLLSKSWQKIRRSHF